MSADATVDLIINQKASFQVIFTVKNGSNTVNLTNYTATAKYKQMHQQSDAQAVSITAAVANAVAGQVAISLTANQTSVMQSGKYVYDVAIVDNTNFKTRIVEGNIRVSPGVA